MGSLHKMGWDELNFDLYHSTITPTLWYVHIEIYKIKKKWLIEQQTDTHLHFFQMCNFVVLFLLLQNIIR